MNKLHETLYGSILSILRRGGLTVNFDQMEAIKSDCDRLADSLIEAAREEALVPAKKLQKATLDAFEVMEKDINDLRKQVISIKTTAV